MEKFQRLLLANQFEILSKIDKENKHNYDEFIWDELCDQLPKSNSRFVLDVLNMYRDIYFSTSNLNLNDQERIESNNTFSQGFDYNDPKEAKLAFYAKFFTKKLNRFSELIEDKKFDGFNSHQLMMNTYERYLANYNKVKSDSKYSHGHMSTDILNQIFSY
ncbi:TPA: hypothetical protein IUD81_002668 [Enterococcus faecalis]|nr:hypothetical protein [Enterococcus faecalis]